MVNAYLFVKRNRLTKKWKIYYQLMKITLDITSLIYIFAMLGYVVFAIYIAGDLDGTIATILSYLNPIFSEGLLEKFIFIPAIYLFRAFKYPGVIFTSAENLLTILPFDRRKIWLLSLLENGLKILSFALPLSFIVYFFTSLSFIKIVSYVIAFMLLHFVMTIIQWRLFQEHLLWKVSVIIFVTGMALGTIFFQTMSFLFWSFMLLLFIYSVRNLFSKVNWQRVITTSDFIVWNMPLISQATKIKFKKDKQYGLFQRFSWWKRPFTYEKNAIYHRLIYLYIEKNIAVILQINGALFLLIIVPSYFHKWYFIFALLVSLYIVSSMLMTLFKDFTTSDIIAAVPWDWKKLQHMFTLWAASTSVILIIPIMFYITYYFSIGYILPTIVIVSYMLLLGIRIKITAFIHLMHESIKGDYLSKIIHYVLFGLILLAPLYAPVLFIAAICILVYEGFIYFRNERLT